MKQRALIALGVSFLILAGAVGAYAFWYLMVSGASTKVAELQQTLALRGNESAQILSARRTLAALQAEDIIFERYFVNEDDIVPFLEVLESAGEGLETTVEVVSVSKEGGPQGARLSVAVSVEGTFNGVMKTLGVIEHGPYDITTTGLTLGHLPGGENASPRWSASGTFSVGTTREALAPEPETPAQ
jgi:hypothetical protein